MLMLSVLRCITDNYGFSVPYSIRDVMHIWIFKCCSFDGQKKERKNCSPYLYKMKLTIAELRWRRPTKVTGSRLVQRNISYSYERRVLKTSCCFRDTFFLSSFFANGIVFGRCENWATKERGRATEEISIKNHLESRPKRGERKKKMGLLCSSACLRCSLNASVISWIAKWMNLTHAG